MAPSFCHGANKESRISSRSFARRVVMFSKSEDCRRRPNGTPRYFTESSLAMAGMSVDWTENIEEPIRDPAMEEDRLLRRDKEEHLSGRKDRFMMSAAAEVESRKFWRPCLEQLMRTRSSAYARTETGWLWM